MDHPNRTPTADVFTYLRYTAQMLADPFDVIRNNKAIEPILDMGFPLVAFYNAYGHDLGHILADIDTSVDDEFFYQGVLNGAALPTLNSLFFRRWLTFCVLRATQFCGIGSIRTSYRSFARGWDLAACLGIGGIGSPLTVPHLDRPVDEVRTRFNVPHGGMAALRQREPPRALEGRCTASSTSLTMQTYAL